jgi:hypothetical protein
MTMRIVALASLGVLGLATVYEALVAFGVIELGSLPGEGPPGERLVALVAVLAMLVAAGLALVAALEAPVRLLALLPPAAAAFLVARFYTFDPYYLPTLRRYSDDGMLPPQLVYAVVALAVGAALLTLVHRRAAAALSALAILACAFFAQVLVGGH